MTYGFHPEAEAEHLETIAWYESRGAGLGARYLVEFERVLTHVCEHPHRHRGPALTMRSNSWFSPRTVTPTMPAVTTTPARC